MCLVVFGLCSVWFVVSLVSLCLAVFTLTCRQPSPAYGPRTPLCGPHTATYDPNTITFVLKTTYFATSFAPRRHELWLRRNPRYTFWRPVRVAYPVHIMFLEARGATATLCKSLLRSSAEGRCAVPL